MPPLASCQRAFTWFCVIYPDVDSLDYRQKLARKVFRLTFAVVFLSAMLLSIISSVKIVSIDLEQSLFAFFQFGVVSISFCGFIALFVSGPKVANIFEQLTAIYDKCKNR